MTRFHSSQPCAWVSPRPKSGLHNTHKLERSPPLVRLPWRLIVTALAVALGLLMGPTVAKTVWLEPMHTGSE